MLELIGQLWVILAALTCYCSARATYRDWGYNKTVTKEISCENQMKQKHNLKPSKLFEGLNGRRTLIRAEPLYLGEAELEQLQLIERRRRIKEPAAGSGTRSFRWHL
jgi:hypothetical protein